MKPAGDLEEKMARSKAVFVDNVLYKSLFQAAIENEFSANFYRRFKKSKGQPFRFKGHFVMSLSFFDSINAKKRNTKKILKITTPAAEVQIPGLTLEQIKTLQTQILCDKNFTCEIIEPPPKNGKERPMT